MTMLRRTIPADISMVGEDQARIRLSTGQRARDGHILDPQACEMADYLKNPIVLFSHDPTEPVGTNSDITVSTDSIDALCTFAPPGVSPTADRVRGLVKAGIIRAVSIGFEILEGEPVEPNRPRAGIRATRWILYEASFVGVPSDTGAIVTARAATEETDMPTDRTEARKRMLVADHRPKLRSLYDCAMLGCLLSQLGYMHSDAAWEAEMEGDDSAVPGMLGEALKQLGDTLIAMTTEEVNELLDGHGIADDDDDILPAAERTFIAAAKTDRTRAWRRGMAAMRTRAGRVLSQGNTKKLNEAAGHLDDAATRADDANTHQTKAADHGESLADLHSRAASAHDKMNAAIEAANGSAPADVAEKIAKVQQHHKALGKHIDNIGERCAAIGDVHADAMGAITGAQRCVRSAIRCVRSVVEDSDNKEVQTSDGAEESGGTENDRAFTADFRKRQAALMELAAA